MRELLRLIGAEPVLADVGASVDTPDVWAPIAADSTYLGFDPDKREAANAAERGFRRTLIVGEAVAAQPGTSELRFHLTRSRVWSRRPQELGALDRPARPRWRHGAHESRVLGIDARASHPRAPLRFRGVVPEPREATQRERVRAQHAAHEVFLDVLAHPLHDRHHRDEEHHGDRDAE